MGNQESNVKKCMIFVLPLQSFGSHVGQACKYKKAYRILLGKTFINCFQGQDRDIRNIDGKVK
jgi:hypothetical protein